MRCAVRRWWPVISSLLTELRIGHHTTSANERHENVGTNENALRKCCARILRRRQAPRGKIHRGLHFYFPWRSPPSVTGEIIPTEGKSGPQIKHPATSSPATPKCDLRWTPPVAPEKPLAPTNNTPDVLLLICEYPKNAHGSAAVVAITNCVRVSLGVGGSGRRPVESAEPGVRRVGLLGPKVIGDLV